MSWKLLLIGIVLLLIELFLAYYIYSKMIGHEEGLGHGFSDAILAVLGFMFLSPFTLMSLVYSFSTEIA